MRSYRSVRLTVIASVFALGLMGLPIARALQVPQERSRFDSVVIPDPSVTVSPEVLPLEAIQRSALVAARWSSFKAARGQAWDVYIDARSGAPLLVQGQGIPIIPGSGNSLQSAKPVTLDSLATAIRGFMLENAALLVAKDTELVLSREASAQLTPDLWLIAFDREVGGVPVAGDRYLFYVGHGNIIAFGASRWSPITTDRTPAVAAPDALALLIEAMGLTADDRTALYDRGTLTIVPMPAVGSTPESFQGAMGTGYRTALAWQFGLTVEGDAGSWQGLVDAHTGAVLALYDANQYATAKGGVFPISNDGRCPDGCEQPNFPMPFANITIGANTQTTGSMGSFSCTPGGSTATTTLQGQYVRVVDTCGPISVSTTCDSDLDLQTSAGTDCTVPAGTSAGNTHAARSSFHHLNRIREHARAWLPANPWLGQPLTDNVNINQTCNAFWSPGAGTVNFYRSGGGCRNTGEIAAIFLHEWGHGFSQNDGAGSSNPDEAYADITSFLLTHSSCIGRGFTSSNCTGYGNACLSCTGIRDMDWDKRANHAPQTPENWPASCPGGSGPCGRAVHCESSLAGETLWDLAVRDLPGAGIDQQTAWQLVDRLWFLSRAGTSGSAYSCGAPATNRSCAATSWFSQLRVVDDDDGNLANGTPHAAQIFAAFNRHNIPCGAAGDATNQNTSTCPTLVAPTLTATAGPNSIALSWAAVPGASTYNVLRNDQGCGWGYNVIARISGTTYTDTGLPNLFPLYYSIQAVGANSACTGTVGACTLAQAGGPHASYTSNAPVADVCATLGAGNNDGIFDAGEQIQFSVTIKNDGVMALTGVTAAITSTTPGVTVVDGSAGYADLFPGANGTSLAPHFTAQLASSLTCGSTISYNITITSNEGSWTGSVTQTVGQPISAGGTVLSENFSGGIPVTWSVVNGGSGGGAAATWTTANPGGRTFTAPLASPVAIVDGDAAGTSATQDEQLITPIMNLSIATAVTLDYDEFFRWYNLGSNELGDVDVRSSATGGAWVNVVRNQGGSNPPGATSTGAAHRSVNITAQAAGAADVQLRFHYYQAGFEWWWQVDNVVVTYVAPGSCNMQPCVAAVCGNGAVDAGEQCDDNNTAGGDCCSPSCQFEAPGSSCNDSNSCTQTDTCSSGVCAGGNPVVCSASDQCHDVGTCAPATGLCSDPVKIDGAPCDDANACTTDDTCQNGICSEGPPVNCDDFNPCTDDSCAPDHGCDHVSNAGPCDDGNGCTGWVGGFDYCDGGQCLPGAPVPVDDGNPCTDDSCDPKTGAVHTANTAPCNDGDPCTESDTCAASSCGGTPVAPLGEVSNQQFSSTSHQTWSVLTSSGPPAAYDVVRGVISQFPVGSGGGEQCLVSSSGATSIDDFDDPADGSGYWYLVRGRNGCSIGSYGAASDSTPRSTSVCP